MPATAPYPPRRSRPRLVVPACSQLLALYCISACILPGQPLVVVREALRWPVSYHLGRRAGFALTAVEPPRTGRRTVGDIDDGAERVQETRIVAATIEVAQVLEQLLGI